MSHFLRKVRIFYRFFIVVFGIFIFRILEPFLALILPLTCTANGCPTTEEKELIARAKKSKSYIESCYELRARIVTAKLEKDLQIAHLDSLKKHLAVRYKTLEEERNENRIEVFANWCQ